MTCLYCLSSSAVEQWIENPCVSGSTPLLDIKLYIKHKISMNNKIIKFLSILKNASLVKKDFIVINYNLLLLKCVEALYKEGLVLSYSVFKDNLDLKLSIKLRNVDDIVLTSKLKSVSKPTHIKYLPYHELCRISLKEKTGFFLTNKGILTLDECKRRRVGGAFSFYS